MENIRRVALSGASNFRDLGGYEAGGDRMTRWGLLYRSDSLDDLSEADWEVLRKRKVRTLIDLRSDIEAAQKKVRPPEGMRTLHFGLMRSLDEGKKAGDSRQAILESMRLDYVKTVREAPEVLSKVMEAILEGLEEGAVVFFCSAGKDRTGIIASLILTLCGVSREDITADYAVSRIYIEKKAAGLKALVQKGFMEGEKDGEFLSLLDEVLDAKPAMIRSLLDAFDGLPLEDFLSRHGFDRASQEKLVRFVTVGPDA